MRPYKFAITRAHHGNRIALRISNDSRFSVIFTCIRLFWRDRAHVSTAFEIIFGEPKVENVHFTCDITLQVKLNSSF